MAVSVLRQRLHGIFLPRSEHKDCDCCYRYIRGNHVVLSGLPIKMPSADYYKAVQRGRRLLEEMAKTPFNTTPSHWTTFASLASEGWHREGEDGRFDRDSVATVPLPDLAPDDNRNSAGSKAVTWKHNANGGAHYSQNYHPAGTILTGLLRSPLNALLRADQSQRESMPNLQHWSDVTFLQWAELTEDVPHLRKGLKKVLHCNVANFLTLKIVYEVLGSYSGQDLAYPGIVFRTDGQGEEAVAALLGTPNGIGTGHLLAEHKEQLGWMEVTSVQLYVDVSWFLVVNVGQRE